jgi:hypothetical protein
MTKLLCTACAAAMSLAATVSGFPAYAKSGPDPVGPAGFTDIRFDHDYRDGSHRGGWHGGWDHPYYRHGWGGGWVPPAAGFVAGMILGDAIASQPVYERVVPVGGAHVRWCYEHHANYNPYSNTFRDGYGYRHVCYAPV